MPQQLIHVHLQHDVETVFLFFEVQDWLAKQLIQLGHVVLVVEVVDDALHYEFVEHLTLCDQLVDVLVLNLPANPVQEQSVLDRIVLTQHWVVFVVPLHKGINEGVDKFV